MRQIKFRVWDKEDNKFFEPTYEAYKGKLVDLSITLSGELMRRTLDFPAEHQSMFPNRYEIMQFTGLLDKNGKEIYEGDILNHKTTFDNNMADQRFQPNTQVIVGFKDGCFIDTNTSSHLSDRIRIVSSFKSEFTDFEIIGNIHENPELINQTND